MNVTSRSSSEPEPHKPRQLDLFEPSLVAASTSDAPSSAVTERQRPDGVGGLLDRFFAEKVRRHDQDQDGCLSRTEFTGADEEFLRLDDDRDGFVGAPDFKRQFLADNPPLQGMAEGFAGQLYDNIMSSPSGDPAALGKIVEEFFADFVGRHDADQDGALRAEEFPGTENELRDALPRGKDALGVDDLVAGFQRQNPDLVELRESLLQLKETVQPAGVRPGQLDLYT